MADNQQAEAVETVKADPKVAWTQAVWDACRGKCSNCGGTDKLRVRMIVPEEAGGRLVATNGALLCRPCDLANSSSPQQESTLRPINFWVSDQLYNALQQTARGTFNSMAALIRFLMQKFVSDPDRYDDLAQYQDQGTNVKVNVWVESDRYAAFKTLVDAHGLTVTDALKSLVLMYEAEAAPRVPNK